MCSEYLTKLAILINMSNHIKSDVYKFPQKTRGEENLTQLITFS